MKYLTLLALGAIVLGGCDSGATTDSETAADETTEATEGTEAVAEPAVVEPEAVPVVEEPASTEPGMLTMETATLPTMGHTMLLPAGFSRDRETETGAGYSLDIGDYRSLMISLEAHGVESADRARSMGPIVAGGLTVVDVEEPSPERYIVTFETRESDGMQAIAVFTATHYVKCMGPEAYLEDLRTMCTSLARDPAVVSP